ncbi:hypothetical protein LEMLEM_LOCUS23606, partial [Lemmus lemmus]
LLPSCQRRPADNSLTRLSGITRAATSTSETAVEATKLCGTRWKVRTRRMVTRTSRFHKKVAAINNTNRVTTSTVKMEKGGSRSGKMSPPGVYPTSLPELGLSLQLSSPGVKAMPGVAAESS